MDGGPGWGRSDDGPPGRRPRRLRHGRGGRAHWREPGDAAGLRGEEADPAAPHSRAAPAATAPTTSPRSAGSPRCSVTASTWPASRRCWRSRRRTTGCAPRSTGCRDRPTTSSRGSGAGRAARHLVGRPDPVDAGLGGVQHQPVVARVLDVAVAGQAGEARLGQRLSSGPSARRSAAACPRRRRGRASGSRRRGPRSARARGCTGDLRGVEVESTAAGAEASGVGRCGPRRGSTRRRTTPARGRAARPTTSAASSTAAASGLAVESTTKRTAQRRSQRLVGLGRQRAVAVEEPVAGGVGLAVPAAGEVGVRREGGRLAVARRRHHLDPSEAGAALLELVDAAAGGRGSATTAGRC